MPTMRPCASAQIISSGKSMSFIQKLQSPSVSKTKSIPVPPGRSDLPESPWLRSASVSATSTAIVVEPIVTVCIGEFSRERTTKATPAAHSISTTIKTFFTIGGGGEIRTHDTLRYAAFPRRCTRPLCDASSYSTKIPYLFVSDQRLYAFLYRRVGHEEFCQGACFCSRAEGVADVEVCGRVVGAAHRLGVRADFSQRIGQALRVAGQERAGGIGQKLALARYGELHEGRDNGREHDERHGDNGQHRVALAVAVAPSPAEEGRAQKEVGRQRYKPHQHHGNGGHQHVAVAGWAQLVRQDALQPGALHCV